MPYRIKNTSPGPRGIHTVGSGIVFIPPGQERTLDPADLDGVRRKSFYEIAELDAQVPAPPKELKTAAASAFDHDGDGKDGGSAKGADSTAAKGAAKRKAPAKAKSATPKKRRRAKAKK